MSSRMMRRDMPACSSVSAYVERHDKALSWPDRWADNLYGRLWLPLASSISDPTRSVRRVLPKVAEQRESLQKMSDSELQSCSQGLKVALRRSGFQPELVAQSLALVCEVAARQLNMRPHDVQIMGAWALLQCHLTEMATGEGKTLTASLAVATAALAGIPVHVVTVNDYLAQRDADIMTPLYQFLGLTVGAVVNASTPDERRRAYRSDITYCTNKELAFDYLKDRVALSRSGGRIQMALDAMNNGQRKADPLLLRGLHYAIVDEADSVFIDEARTPLILSESVDGDKEAAMYRLAINFARQLERTADFAIHANERRIELTESGLVRIDEFVHELDGVWASNRARRELIEQALSALYLFERDQAYVVMDGKVQIVDEFTGRVLADRSWENGLHQMIEVKEGCALSARRVTLARITYQRLFRRYMRLAGMTGTGQEVSGEIWSTYRLRTVAIPQHRRSLRQAYPVRLHEDVRSKWQDVAMRVQELAGRNGRPVLVGTRSVEASEQISALLHEAAVEHVLLNAKQDKEEARAIACAGRAGCVTVATNLAGRGTDIRLDADALMRGGLHVILTECHSSVNLCCTSLLFVDGHIAISATKAMLGRYMLCCATASKNSDFSWSDKKASNIC